MASDKPPSPDKPSASQYAIDDPAEFAKNLLRLMEESGEAFSGAMDQNEKNQGPFSQSNEIGDAAKSMGEAVQHWLSDPVNLAEAQGRLFEDYAQLWNSSLQRFLGGEAEPVVTPEPGDNRFKDADWQDNPYFDFCKQAYLLTTQWAEGMLEDTTGIDDHTKRKAEFYLRQLSSAMSPSNFPATNPEIMRETFKTNGKNLVEGMHNLVVDMKSPGDIMKISQSDLDAFEVGVNLAVTPGKVVFQNEIFQLIQYAPATTRVHRVPLMIVPPWINKFYILDLTPARSFIKYIVEQGFTVFLLSWVNPGKDLADKSFEDYMKSGILAASTAVRKEARVRKINVLGYCVGGTLLASTLAHQAAKGKATYASATFLTTQVDFQKAGDLLLFVDDEQLEALEDLMKERGFLDGSRMANVFNMLRPKDLIWPYIVNNYLLGRKPLPFDLLFWNQDSTRLPARNHSFYLRAFYHDNALATGQMTLDGVQLDVGQITLPIYELAAKDDHIAPPDSVFAGAKLFGGPVDYVLSGSGHIAGVINPPSKNKYQYWVAGRSATDSTYADQDAATRQGLIADDLTSWMGQAVEHKGSWWPHWIKWLTSQSGGKVPARIPGKVLGIIEDAPGSYVRAKG